MNIREALMGPAPCQACGAWVEWNGISWVALGTGDKFHDCEPYLEGARQGSTAMDKAAERGLVVRALPRYDASDLGPRRILRPAAYTEPAWLEAVGFTVKALALLLGVLLVALLVVHPWAP